MISLILKIFGFAAGNAIPLLIAGGSILGTMTVGSLYDKLWDDPKVRREARKEYVEISKLEGERAKRETTERLFEIEKETNAKLQKELEAQEKAAKEFRKEKQEAELANQDLQDEIDEIIRSREIEVPTVGDLNIVDRLRNR